jgi:rod shape-determining protein MreB and related proteins
MAMFNFFTQEIAIDLGTANTLIIHNEEIVVNEPSIIALNRSNPKEVLAVGKKALLMHEKHTYRKAFKRWCNCRF